MKTLASILFILLLVTISFPQNLPQGKMVSYISGKDSIKGFLCMPQSKAPFSAIILIHEWWGLNDWVKTNCSYFAKLGYAALAVDLYRGKSTKSDEEAHELMRGLPEDRAMKDIQAAFDFLLTQKNIDSKNIGIIGWCMGGGYSLSAAVNMPQLSGAIVCYGRLLTDTTTIKKISCPVLGVFGGKDRGIPPEAVHAFDSTAKSLGKIVDVTVYDSVGHAFMNPNNKKGFDADISEKAWKKIIAFVHANLQKKE